MLGHLSSLMQPKPLVADVHALLLIEGLEHAAARLPNRTTARASVTAGALVRVALPGGQSRRSYRVVQAGANQVELLEMCRDRYAGR
jgi:hypothetical protein